MNLKKSGKLIKALAWLAAVALPVAQAAPPADAWAAWSKAHNGGVGVYLAAQRGGQWSEPIELTGGPGANVTPALAADSTGRLWVVWSEHEGINSHLMYATVTAGRATPGRAIASPYRSNLSPSIVIDRTDTPWIAWSGYDGTAEHIFYARWTGSGWTSLERVERGGKAVHEEYPDVLPVLGLGSDGQPWLSWSGFDGDLYHRYQVQWTGQNWSVAEVLAPDNAVQRTLTASGTAAPSLPASAKGAIMGALFMRGGGAVQSLPLRQRYNNKNLELE